MQILQYLFSLEHIFSDISNLSSVGIFFWVLKRSFELFPTFQRRYKDSSDSIWLTNKLYISNTPFWWQNTVDKTYLKFWQKTRNISNLFSHWDTFVSFHYRDINMFQECSIKWRFLLFTAGVTRLNSITTQIYYRRKWKISVFPSKIF